MKKYFVIGLIVLIACFASSCSMSDSNDVKINSETTNQDEFVEYSNDPVINNFIIEFNNKNNNKMSDFKPLSKSDSCDFNGYYTTISLYDNKIEVSVNADSEKHNMSELKDEFVDMVVFMDESITKNEAEKFYDTLINDGVAKENIKIGKVELYYCPTVELSNGLDPGRFDLTIADKNYL